MVEADSHLKLISTSTLHIYKSLSTLICCALAYSKSLTQSQLYPSYLAHILRFFCVTCGVKMMSLCRCWGWQPPQTASHIHITHIQSVWAHWYAVHWHTHTVRALHSSTAHILGFWVTCGVESTWCHNVVVEAEGHLKLLPPSTLDIYKVFEHIDMLCSGIQ